MSDVSEWIEVVESNIAPLLGNVVGEACHIRCANPSGPGEAWGMVTASHGARLQVRTIMDWPEGPVVVTVPSHSLVLETQFHAVLDRDEVLLDAPHWVRAPRKYPLPDPDPMRQPLRFRSERIDQWHSGCALAVNGDGIVFEADCLLYPAEQVTIRLTIPGHPLPLLLRGRIAYVSPKDGVHVHYALFYGLPFQTEAMLVKAFQVGSGADQAVQQGPLGAWQTQAYRSFEESLHLALQMPIRRGQSPETLHPLLARCKDKIEEAMTAMWQDNGVQREILHSNGERFRICLVPTGASEAILLGWDLSFVDQFIQRYFQSLLMVYRDVVHAATEGRLMLADPTEVSEIIGEVLWEEQAPVTTPADVGACRKLVMERLKAAGVQGKTLLETSLCVSEAVTNVLKHATGGELRLARSKQGWTIVVTDNGPGIDFSVLPHSALMSGFSTKPSLGLGFSAMLRVMHRVVIASTPQGVTLLLQLHDDEQKDKV